MNIAQRDSRARNTRFRTRIMPRASSNQTDGFRSKRIDRFCFRTIVNFERIKSKIKSFFFFVKIKIVFTLVASNMHLERFFFFYGSIEKDEISVKFLHKLTCFYFIMKIFEYCFLTVCHFLSFFSLPRKLSAIRKE